MSCALLGETFDIHGGGMDLQFPHHENEIAQSEGALGKPFVRYWLHNGFLTVDNEKMSKSLGNFFTIRDVLKRYDGETLRFFMLRTHYRSPFNFSDAHLDDARAALTRLYTALQSVPPADSRARLVAAAGGGVPCGDERRLQHARVRWPCCSIWPARPTARAIGALTALIKQLAATLGFLQQEPRAYLQGGAALDEATIQSRIAARAAGEGGARLRAGRPHPRRAARAGHRAQGLGPGHHLGQGLSGTG